MDLLLVSREDDCKRTCPERPREEGELVRLGSRYPMDVIINGVSTSIPGSAVNLMT
jgi:hypothetical protein